MEEVRDIDARQAFDELLSRAERGEEIVITRAGRPVARLVQEPQPKAFDREAAKAAVARIIVRREHMSLGGLSIRELIDEGRKY